jgi:hypothetical protein
MRADEVIESCMSLMGQVKTGNTHSEQTFSALNSRHRQAAPD